MSNNICGFKREDGSICQRPAGYLTDHPGYGLCYQHEAGKDKVASLKNRITRFMNDSRPLDLRREIALLRATQERFVESHEDEIGNDTVLNDEVRRTSASIAQLADKQASILGRYDITPDDILYLEKVFIGIIMELTKHDPAQRRHALKLLKDAFPAFKNHGAELIAGASLPDILSSSIANSPDPDRLISDV